MRNFVRSSLALALAACSADPSSAPESVPPDSPPATFHVGGTVTGFAGSGLVLKLGDEDLAISADGSFTFATPLLAGDSFEVTVKSSPMCPERTCTVTKGNGTVAGDVTDVAVSCEVPSYRLASQSWGADEARITDDVGALADKATATPRIISGPATGVEDGQIDGTAIDSKRGRIYISGKSTAAGNVGISVFPADASGDGAPARRIVLTGETSVWGLELDPEADRLYVSVGSGKLLVFDNVSTLDGAATPAAIIPLTYTGPLSLDRFADRLYVGMRAKGLYVFDNARQLAASSLPSRQVTWAVGNVPMAVAIDGCSDRLYVGFRDPLAAHNIYAFDGAAELSGGIDLEAASQARVSVPSSQVTSAVLDTQGAIYFWADSALKAYVVSAPQAWSGEVDATAPDRTINDVVNRGYSLDVQAY